MFSVKYFIFFVFLFGILLLGSGVQIAILVVTIFHGIKGIDHALEALTISFVIFFINPLLSSSNEIVTILRMLLFIVTSFSIIIRTIQKKNNQLA